MKFARFLVLTVAILPIASIAGPLDEFLGSALKAVASVSRDPYKTQQIDEWTRARIGDWDYSKEGTIKGFCADIRGRQSDKGNLPYLEDCEEKYGERFNAAYQNHLALIERRSNQEKEASERKAALQQEEARKSAAEAEKQKAEIAASGVSPEKASAMAGEMYQAYRYGGVGEMLSMENACWSALAKQKRINEAGATSCSIVALSGAFVEASYARQQRRSSAPAYNQNLFRARLLENIEKVGIKEDRAQRVIELSVAHQSSVLVGLTNAGMR